ncbi:MAG: hypothetical protein WCW52_03760 [Elusimicrobiales bacterium]
MGQSVKLLQMSSLLLALSVCASAGALDELKSSASGNTGNKLMPKPAPALVVAAARRAAEKHLVQSSPVINLKVAVWSEGAVDGLPDGLVFTGAAPARKAQYKSLAGLGVKTILNLQGSHSDNSVFCSANGLDCVRYPILAFPKDFADNSYFRDAFRRLVKDTSDGKKVFVHCLGGKHRTGALVLALKVRNTACGKTFDRAALRSDIYNGLTAYGYDGKKYHDILFAWRRDVLSLVDEFEKNQWLCE